MLRRTKKFICSLLALVVVLAPIEFVVADHAMVALQQAGQIEMQHHTQSQQQTMNDMAAEHDCGSQNVCNDCVYCSPALSSMVHAEIDKPLTVTLPAFTLLQYSVDLPVDSRPPRQL